MITYMDVIAVSWLVFLAVWALSALNTKRDIRGGFASM